MKLEKISIDGKKDSLEVTDKIRLTVLNFENLQHAIQENKAYIMSETLTQELVFVDALDAGTEIAFDTIISKILIEKM